MKTVIICIFSIVLSSCGVQLTGNVYKLESTSAILSNEDQDIIKGLRIDALRNDTLLVKYKFSEELFLDTDFVYDGKIKSYRSVDKIILGAEADKKSVILLSIAGKKYIEIEYVDFYVDKKIRYSKIYKMQVDLQTHRDTYYAEDGFSM